MAGQERLSPYGRSIRDMHPVAANLGYPISVMCSSTASLFAQERSTTRAAELSMTLGHSVRPWLLSRISYSRAVIKALSVAVAAGRARSANGHFIAETSGRWGVDAGSLSSIFFPGRPDAEFFVLARSGSLRRRAAAFEGDEWRRRAHLYCDSRGRTARVS